jgi:hypothetical protein
MSPAEKKPLISLSDPDSLRAAIAATDNRARLLRRLLRLTMRLRIHLDAADIQSACDANGSGAIHAN